MSTFNGILASKKLTSTTDHEIEEISEIKMSNVRSYGPCEFTQLGVGAKIVENLNDLNYVNPTPIQSKAIPILLKGKDILATAQTGTGKTAAFLLPLLEKLIGSPTINTSPSGLIIAPTRELAFQIYEALSLYAKNTKIKSAVIIGGVNQKSQEQALSKKPEIVIATPGRLTDLLNQNLISLKGVKTLVLDEADKMLDMGFLPAIKRISAEISRDCQTALFSATMPPAILHLSKSMLKNAERIFIAPPTTAHKQIEEKVFFSPQDQKTKLLINLIEKHSMQRAIVFTNTKYAADRICKKLQLNKISCEALHSGKTQNKRLKTLDSFKNNLIKVLVATDIASRGIDVSELSFVINYDLPKEPETYVHRIGRTGRAGEQGSAFSICSPVESKLFKEIERRSGKKIEVGTL